MTGKDFEELAAKLKALGHPTRLAIIKALAHGEQYLSEIAKRVGISRALAKVHLMKLREAGLVDTRIVTLEDEARALRYYNLRDFEIRLSSKDLKEDETNGL
jgi:DNA-binding transcriptional ArsR family regulator